MAVVAALCMEVPLSNCPCRRRKCGGIAEVSEQCPLHRSLMHSGFFRIHSHSLDRPGRVVRTRRRR